MRPDAERAFRPAIIVPQRTRVALRNLRRLADRRRPCVKAVGLGPDGDVGVHQGGAAQTAAAYYHDRSVNVHLVKPQRVQRRVISLLGHMLDRVREAPDRPFLPSLKHADLQFRIEGRIRQASCRDSPAITRLLSLVVYPRKDRRARRRRVVIRSVVAGKRAGVAVPTLAARNSQTKGSVAQEWDAVDEILVAPGSNRLAGGVQLDPTPDVVHI